MIERSSFKKDIQDDCQLGAAFKAQFIAYTVDRFTGYSLREDCANSTATELTTILQASMPASQDEYKFIFDPLYGMSALKQYADGFYQRVIWSCWRRKFVIEMEACRSMG